MTSIKDESLQTIVEKHRSDFADNDSKFLHRIYSKGLSVYRARLDQYGFVNKQRVLDAGCGFGQWALALAQSNCGVEACDVSPRRVEFLRSVAKDLNVDNLSVQESSLDSLPYDTQSFDAVFCYGVIFLTPWKASLSELTRVLRPGGLLYINANGLGWYKHLWLTAHNAARDYDPRLIAARAFMNTWRYEHGEKPEYGADIIIDEDDCVAELSRLGYRDIRVGDEGTLCASSAQRSPHAPFFQGAYGNDRGVYEVLAQKSV